ncbi:MAG TPA: hypothetical protein PLI30_04835 [Petrimonas sp.]|nr:hypothetical protein [Petrimonas sp.]
MKKLFIFICWSAVSVTYAQFVAQPLNYPGMGYWPYYFSIADPEHVWIGTIHESGIPYSMAVHTDNGGESWIFDSIPVPGIPFITSTASLDSNTCFYVFSDFNVGGGSIWKTDDAGDNWSCLTTTQFDGGFANFYILSLPIPGLRSGIRWMAISRYSLPATVETPGKDCQQSIFLNP